MYLTFKAQDWAEFCEAKQAELAKWKQYNVYTEIEDVGQKHLTGREICAHKLENNITQLKARYVINDSPTGSKDCLEIIYLPLYQVNSGSWTVLILTRHSFKENQ